VSTAMPERTANPSASSGQRLGRKEFGLIADTMYKRFGIDLQGKEILVEARLGKKLRELGMESFERYWKMVEEDRSGEALTAMVDLLTTNHTSFYREMQHFDFLRKEIVSSLPDSARIRIWSAACSTGEEPYTIAFTMLDALKAAQSRRISILATDLSTRVLEAAGQGVYPSHRLGRMPVEQQGRYLMRGTGGAPGSFQVKPEVRSLITFRRINLMEDFSHVGTFEVIFCRNVMIYFDQKTQQSLVNRLSAQLAPGGYLLIGHAESLSGIEHGLRYIRPATYRKATSSSMSFSRRHTDR
jgi:chemotaxis protein methyltransferase CheR